MPQQDQHADVFDLRVNRERVVVTFIGFVVVELLYAVFFSVWLPEAADVRAMGVTLSLAVLQIASVIYLFRAPPSRERLARAATVFLASLALAIVFIEQSVAARAIAPSTGISWSCITILVVPVLIDASPRRMTLIAFSMAVLGPLVYMLLRAAGQTPEQPLDVLAGTFVPPLFCATLAQIPTRMMDAMRGSLYDMRSLGAYQLERRLGEGAMGEVWRARHQHLIRPAAIKLIRPELLGGDDAAVERTLRRFEREAQATAALSSPHSVDLYDFGRADDGALYLAMELLEGVDLETLVREHGPLPPERVAHLLMQVCESLQEAHDAGLVHRDIKPANLFVTRLAGHVDWVKVLDFGLVKLADGDGQNLTMTSEDEIQGTPAFMAPEMVLGEEVGPGADLYGVGCVAYYLLTGRLPFEASSVMAMAVSHVKEFPTMPSRHAPVPPDMDELVLWLLSKSAKERPRTARAVAARLAPLSAGWSQERARAWWNAHLGRLGGPDAPMSIAERISAPPSRDSVPDSGNRADALLRT
ncbi:MAG: serine/threonine-protein kinase [Sandaracinaceae bacterium]